MTHTMRPPVLPTPAQAAWADAELGVIIHLDVQVFEPSYQFRRRWGYTPDPRVFNPPALDTDQWIAAAKAAGATYAVLVAKHCSGFSLWPTRAHDYSVASAPWRGGKGDIVADFVASCRRHGLRPGLYASASCNAKMLVDNPGRVLSSAPAFLAAYSDSPARQGGRDALWADAAAQARYNRVVETQLAELWSNYGPLFELWFDGGVLPPEQGGPDIVPLLLRLQPGAVVFQGPSECPSILRWVGNEAGEAAVDCWSTTRVLSRDDGTQARNDLQGDPNGTRWAPAEADMPLRDQRKAFQGGWFWREGDDRHVYPLDHLVERYFRGVGRNCNLLLGMVIDPRGLVPEADCQRLAEFGGRIRRIFARPVASMHGAGRELTLELPPGRHPSVLGLMEEIAHGERVRRFAVDARTPAGWKEIWRGSCIGHKRLERFEPIDASALRLRLIDSAGEPRIRAFTAWETESDILGCGMLQESILGASPAP
jgi:alpha-L-fucosidase